MTTQLMKLSVDKSDFDTIRAQAADLVKSGFLPQAIKTPEQAVAIILTGRELGVPPMTALNGINVIQGKPTISPQLMLGLIERSGQLEDIRIENLEDGVQVTMKRRGRSPHTEVFGAAEAHAMGLLTKDNYKKQAFTMFKWRAVSACARIAFPDVLLGVYTHEEMNPDALVNEAGEIANVPAPVQVRSASITIENVIDAEVEDVKPKKKPKVKKDDDEKAKLIAKCGDGFRALNKLDLGVKWDKASISEMLEIEYSKSDIHDLDLKELSDLIVRLRSIYAMHTEPADNPEKAMA